MSAHEASDTFIGRLFSRIRPGSSYAAFPWRSWDRICSILETIRGRGIRIKRSRNENKWELDATVGALDHPNAYSVYVHDPDEDGADESLPNLMRNDEDATVYCYVPFDADTYGAEGDSGIHIAGANGPDQRGDFGAMAEEEWPERSHWGWLRVGVLDGSDDAKVVWGTIVSPGTGDHGSGPEFSGIALGTEAEFEEAARASEAGAVVVPIAWISGTNVVQSLCGRPWACGGGGGCELFVARITGGPNDDGSLPCLVSRASGGPGDVSTEAILLRPDLKRMGTIALNTAVLAHRVSVRYSEGTEADHPEPVAGEED